MDLYSFEKWQKGVIFPQEPWADVTRRGTCTDVTWHKRPRGRATQTHTGACVTLMWHRLMVGPCECTQTPGWRHVARGSSGWQMMSPRVSGPGNKLGR